MHSNEKNLMYFNRRSLMGSALCWLFYKRVAELDLRPFNNTTHHPLWCTHKLQGKSVLRGLFFPLKFGWVSANEGDVRVHSNDERDHSDDGSKDKEERGTQPNAHPHVIQNLGLSSGLLSIRG